MAKARARQNVKDRAVAIWRKEHDPVSMPDGKGWKVRVWKNRTKQTITVEREVPWASKSRMTWSYKGGNLRRISA